jgi:hypothetical protein
MTKCKFKQCCRMLPTAVFTTWCKLRECPVQGCTQAHPRAPGAPALAAPAACARDEKLRQQQAQCHQRRTHFGNSLHVRQQRLVIAGLYNCFQELHQALAPCRQFNSTATSAACTVLPVRLKPDASAVSSRGSSRYAHCRLHRATNVNSQHLAASEHLVGRLRRLRCGRHELRSCGVKQQSYDARNWPENIGTGRRRPHPRPESVWTQRFPREPGPERAS